jgi:hypothetical protein
VLPKSGFHCRYRDSLLGAAKRVLESARENDDAP